MKLVIYIVFYDYFLSLLQARMTRIDINGPLERLYTYSRFVRHVVESTF